MRVLLVDMLNLENIININQSSYQWRQLEKKSEEKTYSQYSSNVFNGWTWR